MKKFIINSAIMAILSTSSYAQDGAVQAEDKASRKAQRQEKIEKMSPEQKQRMMERKEKFKALSPEKQKAAKAEMKRHREEMKKITGEDFSDKRDSDQ